MSKRALRRVVIVAVALATPAIARAQAPNTEEGLMRHLDTLQVLLADAQRAVEEAEALRMRDVLQNAVSTDTFAVGPLRVVTLSDQVEEARSIIGEAWADYAGFVGQSERVEGTYLEFQWARTFEPIYLDRPGGVVRVGSWKERSQVVNAVRQAIAVQLQQELGGTELGRWTNGLVRAPLVPGDRYRELGVGAAAVNRACIDGATGACWTALGLDLDDYPYDDWYSPAERRALVARVYGERLARIDAGSNPAIRSCVDLTGAGGCEALMAREDELTRSSRACLQREEIDACDEMIRGRRDLNVRAIWQEPLSRDGGRTLMIWVALQAGGSGAWDRLMEDPEMTPEDALLYASGLPREGLAVAWRDWVFAHRPVTQAGLGWALGRSLLWILLLAALAARSSRWRLA